MSQSVLKIHLSTEYKRRLSHLVRWFLDDLTDTVYDESPCLQSFTASDAKPADDE